MKVVSISIHKVGGTPEPVLLSGAQDLSSFGFFQRGSVREMVSFFTRTFIQRTPKGKRQSVEHEEFMVHCYLRGDGLGACFVADKEYPPRVAFTLLSQLLEQFEVAHRDKWAAITADTAIPFEPLEKALVEYQDPSKADKITKIQKDLDDTMEVMHKTIDNVLERGVKLDSLVEKSDDLSEQSKLFYKTAKKHNSCCTIA